MLVDLSVLVASASLVFKPQRAVWGNEKARSRQNGASSICRFPAFSDCFAICGPRSGPAQTLVSYLSNLVASAASGTAALSAAGTAAPNFDAKQTKLGCNPRFGNDGVSRQMVRQHHSLKTRAARMELAQIRADFVFRRISEALFAARSFHQLAETRNINNPSGIADSLLCSFLSSVRRRRTEGVNFIN